MPLSSRKAAIGIENLSDGGVVTCADEVETLPASNLQLQPLGDTVLRTQSTTPSATVIEVDLIQAKTVNVIDLRLHNLTPDATFRVTGSNDSGHASPVYGPTSFLPVGAVEGWERNALTHLIFDDVAARYWRIELSDEMNPDGYLQAARLGMYEAWQPVRSFTWDGIKIDVDPEDEVEKAPGGAEYYELSPFRRTATISLMALDDDERVELIILMSSQMGHGDVLVVPFPSVPENWHVDNVYGCPGGLGLSSSEYGWQSEIAVRERVAPSNE